jgi:diaminopimelate epimerase
VNNIPFWKMSGSGNDFVVIDARKNPLDGIVISDFVSKVCRRGLSVGADGVILVKESQKADYRWHYYNADGGEVAMCGNGSRCVARFAYENKIAPAKHTIETLAGIIHAEVMGDRVRVQLTNPTDFRAYKNIELSRTTLEGHFINTGVPHVVYFLEDIENEALMTYGKETRYHSLFAPNGTNANFVKVIDRHRLLIRTYERGVEDETLACGTGSVAAAVIAATLGKTDSPISVQTRSGILLEVTFSKENQQFNDVMLEGDARIIYKGVLSEEALL